MGIAKSIGPKVARVLSAISLLTCVCAAQPSQQATGAAPLLPTEVPATAEHYSVLIMGNLAGQQAVWTASDGSLHIFYQYNDRGRGPRTTSIIRLNAKDVPIAESVDGNDYLKSPVHETYSLEGGRARWKNGSEEGEKRLLETTVYVALNGAPAELGVLARAALTQGGKIALLSGGEATVERLVATDLETSGWRRQATLYSITGLDFSPTYVWMDDRSRFFAFINPWLTVIPEGRVGAARSLETSQNRVAQDRAARLATSLSHRAPNGVEFTHANLFDSDAGKILENQSVVVIGNHIRSVGPSDRAAHPAGAQIINASGKTMLPGLWDMHAHVTDNDGLLDLAAGVTTVRDLANDTESLLARRRRIEEGKEIGTRIVLAGIIDSPGPYQGPTRVLVSTPGEARAAVDNYKRLGYVQIKIYSSVKPELVPVIIAEAHRLGLRVSGHIPAEMAASQCVELGFDEIQHANFLMLNFWPEIKNTNTTARFIEVAKRGADLDLNSVQMRSFIKLLQDHHTVLDPTLSIFEDMFTEPSGKIPRGYQPVAGRLPPEVRRALFSSGLTPPAGMEERYPKAFTKMLALVGLMYRSGIPIEAGRDSMAGFALDRELELHVQAGIPAQRVLQDATLGAARIMKLDSELGSIAPGKLADLVLVNGDPVATISDIRKTALVMKDGVLYKPEELDAALGVRP